MKHILVLLAFCFYSFSASAQTQVFEIDPLKYAIIPAKAIGRETVLSIANRKGALLAINGGFFSRDGLPAGILKIQGEWYGLPTKPRGAIGWRAGGEEVIFDRLLIHQEGDTICVDPQTNATTGAQWDLMENIVGGAPLLIQNGVKIVDFAPEQTIDSFLMESHARTAVGLLPNGNWVFVVVDGMRIDELADFMESLGCTEALNLDGGARRCASIKVK